MHNPSSLKLPSVREGLDLFLRWVADRFRLNPSRMKYVSDPRRLRWSL